MSLDRWCSELHEGVDHLHLSIQLLRGRVPLGFGSIEADMVSPFELSDFDNFPAGNIIWLTKAVVTDARTFVIVV